MKKYFLLGLMFMAGSVLAKNAPIEVSGTKIYAPLKGSNATAGYGVVQNTTDKEIVLKISKIPPFKAVETHVTKEKDGHMAMEKVESFKIPAKGTLELKPGGHHIMLFDPSREVRTGEELTVQFSVDGKNIDTKFKVEDRIEPKDSHTGHH